MPTQYHEGFRCLCGAYYEDSEGGTGQRSEPISVEVVSASKDENGRITITYLDGTTDEYLDVAAMVEQIGQVETIEHLKRINLGRLVAHSPNATDFTSIVGKTITMNLAGEFPFQIVG